MSAGSLPRAWAGLWHATPDQNALADVGASWVTNRDLLERTAAVATYLRNRGIVAGDRILMSSPPSVALVIAHVAALRLGCIVVPVNTAYTASEVTSVAEQARPVFAVVDDPTRLPDIASLTPEALVGDAVGAVGAVGAVEAAEDVISTAPDSTLLDAAATDDPALLMFTSGTTGKPKGVVLTHGNILASAEALRIAWKWSAADRLVLALPLFHMHGLGVGVHGTLLAGASAIVVPKFDVDTVFDAARDFDATLMFGVPTMWVRLVESPRSVELSRLRLCVSGSAPLSPDVFSALVEQGSQTILERYGMTETVMNVSNPYDGERRPGSVGFALPGVMVRLAGDPSLPPTDPGEILLKGPNVMHTYWENPEATTAAFDAEGWFLTGDIGQFDPDGYLRIVGRSKDLIITGGFNVYPREVEEALLLHPSVAECAVAGRPDPQWGETVVAYVVLARGHDSTGDLGDIEDPEAVKATILEHAEKHLARFKQPRSICFLGSLPRNALGKVLKNELH